MLLYLLLLAFWAFLFAYVVSKLTMGRVKSPVCLVGKTAIVTGGNEGIGFQVCLMLASRGCRVIIADVANSEESKRKIIEETNNPNIITKHIDLASFKSIREFAEDIIKTETNLDILIHNAGVSVSLPTTTGDGVNKTFQINYYGPFLLTHLLIGLLKKSAPSRVIFTSSAASFINNLSEDNLNPNEVINDYVQGSKQYANTKTCIIMAANEFAKRLKGTGVTVNSLHPGLVQTKTITNGVKLTKNMGVFQLFLYYMTMFFTYTLGKTSYEGAQTTVNLAVDKKLDNVTGKYFLDCMTLFVLPPNVNNSKLAEAVWRKSEELTQLKESEKLR